jgi:hypothetical protein
MATVYKSITAVPEMYITLQGGVDTVVINKIETPSWVHEGQKLIIEFDQTNIGEGVWIQQWSQYDNNGQNIKLHPFGFKRENVNLDSGFEDGSHSISWILQCLNQIVNGGSNAAAFLTKAQAANSKALMKTLTWNELQQVTINGIKGTGPVLGFDYTNLNPVFTFIWDGTFWKQCAFAYNNFS